ncbi:type 1 glutamine amidotransferase domain-containing protein [Niabella sp. CC-SYL272]|uniref:type 1 glutamine amidotransferase domain-containing protein n=1 Tax=Niabella agricola TaxID=2891571 RepID=UPI001F25AFD4|nr:type 1 glutamine amidotransferase domain-containing protein [Niabella agricola]MCF3109392.1 type 1 glutamine amidotransferase domain-containing protein [Niabella agricola]
MNRILMVLTSHAGMENTESTTGVWLGEFTDPYYEFTDAGWQVTLCSPDGGKPPVDPLSTVTENITQSNRRFIDDPVAKAAFENTYTLREIDPTMYDAVFYPGGHGPLWDLASNELSGRLILHYLTAGKPVGAVCHGPAALIMAAELKPSLLAGKRITAFTNEEEVLALRANHIPYKLETRLKELGADFRSAALPFVSHVEVDGLLVTGQNPLSAGATARRLIGLVNEQSESLSAHK